MVSDFERMYGRLPAQQDDTIAETAHFVWRKQRAGMLPNTEQHGIND